MNTIPSKPFDNIGPGKHMRQVKSFVRRAGRSTPGQKRAMEQLWPQWGIEIEPSIVELATLFGNSAPVILEIGFGMGDSLAEMAQQNPQTNYIGIEVHPPGIGHLLSLIEQQQLSNIRISHHDAIEVLKNNIADCSLYGVQIFFPDPWHKKKHHKRRLIQLDFIKLLAQKIASDGILHIATDWQDYAEHIVEVMQSCAEFNNTASHGEYSPRPTSRPLTKFENRGKNLGHGVWDLIYQRTIR